MLDTSLADLVLAVLSSVGVQSQQYLSVLEWVLLLHTCSLGEGIALWFLKDGLDFTRVDQSVNVGVADNIGWEEEVFLEG